MEKDLTMRARPGSGSVFLVRAAIAAAGLYVLLAGQALAEAPADATAPPDLEALLSAGPGEAAASDFGGEARQRAMRHAALSYGARAGLARRSWEIAALLEGQGEHLDRIYGFRDLLLSREGFTVLPPVVAETRGAFRLGRDRSRAATAERVVRIVAPGRLVSAAPGWRDYLMRSWPPAAAPAAVLFPRGAEEDDRWRGWLEEGWARGVALAEDIFQADLDRLGRDFEGVVLWRRLHLAGMATAPAVSVVRRGVSGGGDLLRIGEAEAELGVPARLVPDSRRWRVLVEDAGELE